MCSRDTAPAGYDVGGLREKLAGWFDNVVDFKWTDFIQPDGGSCEGRANRFIPEAFKVIATPLTENDTKKKGVVSAARMKLYSTWDKRPKVVPYKTKGTFAGGTTSRFGENVHWVILIEVAVVNQVDWCVVWDPEVTGTLRSSGAWAKRKKEFDEGKLTPRQLIDKMILGKGEQLGPLIRYHYDGDDCTC